MEQLRLTMPRQRRPRARLWVPGIPVHDLPGVEVVPEPAARCWCARAADDLVPEVDGAMRWRPDLDELPSRVQRRRRGAVAGW